MLLHDCGYADILFHKVQCDPSPDRENLGIGNGSIDTSRPTAGSQIANRNSNSARAAVRRIASNFIPAAASLAAVWRQHEHVEAPLSHDRAFLLLTSQVVRIAHTCVANWSLHTLILSCFLQLVARYHVS